MVIVTGAHVLAPIPGVWPAKPGSATLPFFGVQPAMVNEQVSMTQHSTAQHGTAQHCTAQHSTAQRHLLASMFSVLPTGVFQQVCIIWYYGL